VAKMPCKTCSYQRRAQCGVKTRTFLFARLRLNVKPLSFLILLTPGCRPASPAPATIEDIQYAAVAIDLDTANLREDTRSVDNTPVDASTTVIRFRTGRKLRKVVARIYDDAGFTHDTFYLHNGLPFLVVTHFIWFADKFSQRVTHTLTDSLYYAHATLLRSMSVDSPGVYPLERHLSTPFDSVTARLQKYLDLKPRR